MGDDVCFNDWLQNFSSILFELGNSSGKFVYDEGEQGTPAYVFERINDVLCISIIDSEVSDGKAHPDWQNIECSAMQFLFEVEKFIERFKQEVISQNSVKGPIWLAIVLGDKKQGDK